MQVLKEYEDKVPLPTSVYVATKLSANGIRTRVDVIEKYCETKEECWRVIHLNHLANGKWQPMEVSELPPQWSAHRSVILEEMRSNKAIKLFRETEPERMRELLRKQ